MSLVVNHNLMAANVARNLNSHYANLSNSTQRLSTGLRINSAADDAAGLAIRELQRADIAALHQGARNANDAISLIQVADGALQIIDEKLIRMKELAEQAATGTYDSMQRLMIESEYQAMASEITRIANATDFNGIHLLDGTLESDKHDGSGLTATGKLKVHFGTGNDSAEDYYYIKIGESTAQAFGLGDASTWEDAITRISKTFSESLNSKLDNLLANSEYGDDLKQAIKVAAESWNSEFVTNVEKFSNFTSSNELSRLYNSFKDDEEVSGLGQLFEQYINNFDSLTDRDSQKMQYALGRAAMRSLASYPNIVTGFNDKVNQYHVNSSSNGILGNVNFSAFTSNDNGAIISYNPSATSGLVFAPPADYNSITYNSDTGKNAPVNYPLTFTSPLVLASTSNSLPGNDGRTYSFTTSGDLLSYTVTTTTPTAASTTTLYNGSKVSGYTDSKGISTFNSDENPISYLNTGATDTNDRTLFDGSSSTDTNKILEYYDSSEGAVTTFHTNEKIKSYIDEDTNETTFRDTDESIMSYLDKGGNTTQFNLSGNAIEHKDSSGNRTTLDTSGEIVSYTDVDGNITTFADDSVTERRFSSYQDINRNITEFDVNTGQVARFTDAKGNKVVLTTVGNFDTAIVSDANGNSVSAGEEFDEIIRNAQSLSTSAKIAATTAYGMALSAQHLATDSTALPSNTTRIGIYTVGANTVTSVGGTLKYVTNALGVGEFDTSGKLEYFTSAATGTRVKLSSPIAPAATVTYPGNASDTVNGVASTDTTQAAYGSLRAEIEAMAEAAYDIVNSEKEALLGHKGSADAAKTTATTAKGLATTAKTNANTARTSATSYIEATTNMINDDVDPTSSDFYKLTSALNETLGKALSDAATSADKYDYAGYTIATQEDAQKALNAINNAIEAKDKIRADLGAKQNRLENTISNLNIQAENLQAAESRISDVDVSTEMTEFVRQQILTQSAVAMLSQANSLPQMAMQLIGG